MNKHETLPEDKGGDHLLYTQRSPDQQSNRKRVNITSLKCWHCGTAHVVQPHQGCQNTSWYRVGSHPTSACPHPASATLLKHVAKPWRNLRWQQGHSPVGQGSQGKKEMEIKPGRGLRNGKEDMSNRKQTYLTLQSLIRLALRATQLISPFL